MILAVDPGITGALASFDEAAMRLIAVTDMPVTTTMKRGRERNAIDVIEMTDWLRVHYEMGARCIAIEHVQGLPGQGAPSAFTFGYGFGELLGTSRILGFNVRLVRPQEWHKDHFIRGRGRDKASSRNRATKLMPDAAHNWKRVKDHGRAEAALIAWWYAEQLAKEMTS